MESLGERISSNLANLEEVKLTQKIDIKQWLEHGKKLTPLEALDKFGCFRLAARIDDLRREGLEIETEMKYERGKRFASYGMARG